MLKAYNSHRLALRLSNRQLSYWSPVKPTKPVGSSVKTTADFEYCAQKFKVISDVRRLELINLLFGGEFTVSAIAEAAGQDIVMASHHLTVLHSAKIVARRKQGRFIYYSLHPDVICREDGQVVRQLNLGSCRVRFTGLPRLKVKSNS